MKNEYYISPHTLERLKAKAKSDNVSVNMLIERTLSEVVKDVKSTSEIDEGIMTTDRFINEFAGMWSGPEYEKIAEEIY